MKNIFSLLALAFLLAVPAAAQAADDSTMTKTNVAYTATDGRMVKVTDIANLNDDAMVRLTGTIQEKTGGEKYRFNDGTGDITLKIKDDMWQSMSFGPNERVTVYGEVDKGIISSPEINSPASPEPIKPPGGFRRTLRPDSLRKLAVSSSGRPSNLAERTVHRDNSRFTETPKNPEAIQGFFMAHPGHWADSAYGRAARPFPSGLFSNNFKLIFNIA